MAAARAIAANRVSGPPVVSLQELHRNGIGDAGLTRARSTGAAIPQTAAVFRTDGAVHSTFVHRKALQTGPLPSSRLNSPEPQVEVADEFAPGALSTRFCDVDSPPMPPATKTPTKPGVAAPERSLVQRMEALERANEIRTRRAQLKRDLKGAAAKIHDLLLEPPEYVETAKVFDMLLAVPKYGRVKVNKVLVQCRISPSKTIGGLSQRQRTELVSMLRR